MNTIFKNTVKYLCNNQSVISRTYAFKSDLKIKWVRPEKILSIKPQKSGDQSAMPKLDKTLAPLEFQNSRELEDADENVKKLFTLEFSRGSKVAELYVRSMVDQVKRHDLDFGSMESTLAKQTANIRRLQDIMEQHPRNKKIKVVLKELIDKRKRFLSKLRRWDYGRFEWILEKLDLIYKAYPSQYHWITRKESLQKLTNTHCDSIRNDRLAAYRKDLQSQQLDFLLRKLENQQTIRAEQWECGFPLTISENAIKETEHRIKELKIKQEEEAERERKARLLQ